MPRLVIAIVLALAATAAHAEDATSGPSRTPVPGPNATQPFLFDGRMRGDGVRPRARTDDHRPGAGAGVVQPKEGQPERKR